MVSTLSLSSADEADDAAAVLLAHHDGALRVGGVAVGSEEVGEAGGRGEQLSDVAVGSDGAEFVLRAVDEPETAMARNCGPSVNPNPVATSSGFAPGGMRASSAGSRRSTEGSGGVGVVVLMGTEMAIAAAAAMRRSGMGEMVAQRMVASDGPKYRGPSPPLRMTAKLRPGFARLFSSMAIHGREHWKKRTKLDHCRARSRLILAFSRAS